ncbi:hypothetical protein OSB04_010767 [Centaurea solstitialis]|uniref:3'-5' exonuclease domain-containing protein n=1 Tax=Centaurea solstitialis TaxID=347529 RepID=A0AA38T872_9ASTR|nr:hypothetical protein OSB04_010767 [Centaurea solstitialis]
MAFRSSTNNPTSIKYHVRYDGKTIETTVTKKSAIVTRWVDEILLLHANTPKVVVGLDVEWRPHPISSMSNKSATLQLCINTKCLILQLFYMDEIPQSLKNFLLNPKFIFVGVEVDRAGPGDFLHRASKISGPALEVDGDISKLHNEYGLACDKRADIRAMVVKKWPLRYYRKPGLKALANDVVGLYMSKPMHVCKSNWDAMELNEEQVEYACIDAYASYKIAYKLFFESY